MKISSSQNSTQLLMARIISLLVGLYGLYVIALTLVDQLKIHRFHFVNSFIIDTHLLFGFGFIYLSLLLLRLKKNALIVTILAFTLMLGEGLSEISAHHSDRPLAMLIVFRSILVPLIVMGSLLLARDEFKVKSDLSAFRNSVKLAVIVILITIGYGVGGFMLMDKSDFHQEIGFNSALHHTIDQFDLTTNRPLIPYTRKAKLFMGSLSFVSIIALVYLTLSLFQPVRFRLNDQSSNRKKIYYLMEQFGAPSEDFFKIWPHDKHYFFDTNEDAALAYTVRRGVALVLADPVGNKASYKRLILQFEEFCWANDWQPSLVHIDNQYLEFYRDQGYQLQLLGQEAIVDIDKFVTETARDKYFRNIKNRFTKDNYQVEVLSPPHHKAIVDRTRVISDEWLAKPGRTERGFVMGYYSEEYLQQCRLVVVRDAAQTIQAFMNLIPSEGYNKQEVTYDMLRGTKDAISNINDFMLYSLLHLLQEENKKIFNMGLCPLVGLDENTEDNNLISSVMRFAYANGDRFYSFSGLRRFKVKYDPEWSDRYIAYRGGVAGFTKLLNALNLAMKLKR